MNNVSAADVATALGKAKSTFLSYVNSGYFPKPKKNGLSTFWEKSVVDAWIILSADSRATLPPITVDDLHEIQACVAKIKADKQTA